jgi:alginate O-acetyltransferase complex protein AlgJ
LRQLLAANGNFAAGLNTWFDDRMGFRDLFIRTKNQIDYSLFRTSRKVFVGADGWLFAKEDSALPVERLDAAGLATLESQFVELAQLLDARGIRLIVIGYPDKSKIYPEMAPPQMPLVPPGGNADRLRRFLAEQQSLMFVDAQDILQREKPRNPDRLFIKHDMHPTIVGQLPVAKEIVARIATAEGRPELRWDRRLTVKHGLFLGGGEARLLSVLRRLYEQNLPVYAEEEWVGRESPDGSWYVPDPRVLSAADDGVGRAFDFEFRSRPELCPARLPGTVLFGNSFSDLYWQLGLQHYFCFIRRVRDPISRFKLFYETIPEGTKYFIFQFWIPWLPDDAPPIEDISGKGAG